MHDVTFEKDQLDKADPAPDWAGEIPVDGAPSPDPFLRLLAAGVPEAEAIEIMDAPYLSFEEWRERRAA